ncbi:MAG: hypothetical protein JKY57_04220 [Kordiimonadaceae bacterium]|nr:hypothetical protein [Kordiimonadaceae bacterium]
MSSLKKKRPEPSYYLTQEYYEKLMCWRREAESFSPTDSITLQAACTAILNLEARLLDTRRFEEWLNLYSEDCVYWLPAYLNVDPRENVNVAFDDRRRLEDRIIRLETGFAHNQSPDRRLRRLVSNIEAWEAEDGKTRRVMAKEHVFEHRTGTHMIDYVVALDYWLTLTEQGWRIKVKYAELINSVDGLDTPTFL